MTKTWSIYSYYHYLVSNIFPLTGYYYLYCSSIQRSSQSWSLFPAACSNTTAHTKRTMQPDKPGTPMPGLAELGAVINSAIATFPQIGFPYMAQIFPVSGFKKSFIFSMQSVTIKSQKPTDKIISLGN